jgi:hypothetical protein
MSDHAGATSRDFGFQTSDQARGVAQQHPQQLYGGYNGELDTNASGAPDAANQAYVHEATINHHDYSAHQHQVAPGQLTGFGFSPSMPSGWDWTNSIDFAEFTNQYEPQGELVQEYHNQMNTTNDFSIPLPITAGESAYQALQQNQSATPTPNTTQTQNPLSPPPPPRTSQQEPVVQTGMKRKIDSEPASAVSQNGSTATENPSKRQNRSRQSSEASITSPVLATPANARPPPTTRAAAPPPPSEAVPQPSLQDSPQTDRRKGTGPQGRVIDVSTPRRVQETPGGQGILPAGKVFPIQIGSELFRLSGASISSDGKQRRKHEISELPAKTTRAPSYFSHFFGQQLHDNGGRAGDVRTLYIDRDPDTFRDIALHLQGYHITPKDGEHFVKLFADSQFYSRKLIN